MLSYIVGLLNLIESYVDAINSGAVPDIENTWETVARQENARQRDKIVNVCFFNDNPHLYSRNTKKT